MSVDFVASLARGLEVLQAFSHDRPEMTLTEVASIAGVSPAAARRSLLTLQELGFVTSHKRHFLLTPRVLRLSEAFLSSMNMQEVAQQFLQDIVDATGDSASVAVLDGPDILYIASVPAKRSFQLTPSIGTRYPAYCTSLGRALLAYSPPDVVDKALAESRFEKLTEKTETDPARIRGILDEIRTSGMAAIEDELAYGVVSVAMPVLNGSGFAVAAVNCSTSPVRTGLVDMAQTRRRALLIAQTQIAAALRQYPALVHSIDGSRR